MTIIFYNTPATIQAGITIKNNQEQEQFNVALHACNNPQAVSINRAKLAKRIGLPLDAFVFANQTHSANFVKLSNDEKGLGAFSLSNAITEVDAMYTFEPNLVCTSLTADCVPILFYSEKENLVGAVHSGWGGSVKEITLHLFEHIKNEENVDLSGVQVHIGRALSKEKFEVDGDVAEKFMALGYADPWITFNKKTNKFHIDNQLIVQKQCELAGILPGNITIGRTCTYKDEHSFSFREDRECGRHVSFIVRTEAK